MKTHANKKTSTTSTQPLLAKNGTPVKAWHYTLGTKLLGIMDLQAIFPAVARTDEQERPAVWFSTLDRWEPTATKGIRQKNGVIRDATMQEMERQLGLYRLGVGADYPLIDMQEFRKTSGITRRSFKLLKKVGIKKGAHPDCWLTSYKPVPMSDIVAVERFINGRWADCPICDGSIQLVPTDNEKDIPDGIKCCTVADSNKHLKNIVDHRIGGDTTRS